MDFFAQQDESRGKTNKLIFLFIMAIGGVIISVYAVVMLAFYNLSNSPKTGHSRYAFEIFDPSIFFAVSFVTLIIIFLGSFFKILQLRKGGSYIAESLGGRLVNVATTDQFERRLLNVVEEMAIASGISVPQVYVLDSEMGINAFAAGYSPNDAVIGVTQGCLKTFNRDELQGVIAHEFSHILNGDMRLNIKLIGFLSGILVISNIGYILMRSNSGYETRIGAHHNNRRDSDNKIAIVGLGFLIVGYIGVLIGRLIQCSISRQREYLADASSVQFTRNPEGIACALKKIGGFINGSKILSSAAGEASHMFFGNAISSKLFSTHPPLVDRIRRIDPTFSGEFKESLIQPVSLSEESSQVVSSLNAGTLSAGTIVGERIKTDSQSIMNHVGSMSQNNVILSAGLLSSIPASIKGELDNILGAMSIVCALLLDSNADNRQKQFDLLSAKAPQELLRHIEIVYPRIANLDPQLKLPVVDLAIATLRLMSLPQYEDLISYIKTLAEADSQISLFEFSLMEVILRRLALAFYPKSKSDVYKNITPLIPHVTQLLSSLAYAGSSSKVEAQQAFEAGIAGMTIGKERIGLVPSSDISYQAIHDALEHFAMASQDIKREVLYACIRCSFFDESVSLQESELLRTVAHSMNIPLPPFLPA